MLIRETNNRAYIYEESTLRFDSGNLAVVSGIQLVGRYTPSRRIETLEVIPEFLGELYSTLNLGGKAMGGRIGRRHLRVKGKCVRLPIRVLGLSRSMKTVGYLVSPTQRAP